MWCGRTDRARAKQAASTTARSSGWGRTRSARKPHEQALTALVSLLTQGGSEGSYLYPGVEYHWDESVATYAGWNVTAIAGNANSFCATYSNGKATCWGQVRRRAIRD